MKKLISIFLSIMLLVIIGCGETKKIDNITYDTYGILNIADKKNDNIEYNLIIGNVIWGIVLVETIIAPVYFFGFSLYEPVGVKGKVIKGKI